MTSIRTVGCIKWVCDNEPIRSVVTSVIGGHLSVIVCAIIVGYIYIIMT